MVIPVSVDVPTFSELKAMKLKVQIGLRREESTTGNTAIAPRLLVAQFRVTRRVTHSSLREEQYYVPYATVAPILCGHGALPLATPSV